MKSLQRIITHRYEERYSNIKRLLMTGLRISDCTIHADHIKALLDSMISDI